jgi:hypothetical protein
LLKATLAVFAALVVVVVLAILNVMLWQGPARRPVSNWPLLASVTGFPWFWPNAPKRFLLYNLPLWGGVAAMAYGLLWAKLSGRPVRWLRVATLWAGMTITIFVLAFLVRKGSLVGDHAATLTIWIYLIVGIPVAKDWVVR